MDDNAVYDPKLMDTSLIAAPQISQVCRLVVRPIARANRTMRTLNLSI